MYGGRSIRGGQVEGGYLFYPSASEVQEYIQKARAELPDKFKDLPDMFLEPFARARLAQDRGPMARTAQAAEAVSQALNSLTTAAGSAASSAAPSAYNTASQAASGAYRSVAGAYQSAAMGYSNRNTALGNKAYKQARCDAPFRGARAMSVKYNSPVMFSRSIDCSNLSDEQQALFDTWQTKAEAEGCAVMPKCKTTAYGAIATQIPGSIQSTFTLGGGRQRMAKRTSRRKLTRKTPKRRAMPRRSAESPKRRF